MNCHVLQISLSSDALWPSTLDNTASQTLTMQRLIRLHHLWHEHWPLTGYGGQWAQSCSEVNAGNGWMDHKLQQLLQRSLSLLTQDICEKWCQDIVIQAPSWIQFVKMKSLNGFLIFVPYLMYEWSLGTLSRLMSPSCRLGTSESDVRGDRVMISDSVNLMEWVRTPSFSESSKARTSSFICVTKSQHASCTSDNTLKRTNHWHETDRRINVNVKCEKRTDNESKYSYKETKYITYTEFSL